jgi:hypothetical protein
VFPAAVPAQVDDQRGNLVTVDEPEQPLVEGGERLGRMIADAVELEVDQAVLGQILIPVQDVGVAQVQRQR